MVISNFINLNIRQPMMLLKNLTHLGSNGANVPLVEAAQMERASEMVNLFDRHFTLISQSAINILAEILEVRNQAINGKRVRHSKLDFQSSGHIEDAWLGLGRR